MPRSVLSSSLRIRRRGGASWVQLFVLSIVQVGLLAMVILSFLPNQATADLTLTIKRLFIGPEAQFVWITLPILVIILMRRKRGLTKLGK
jgi:hypothetical protein